MIYPLLPSTITPEPPPPNSLSLGICGCPKNRSKNGSSENGFLCVATFPLIAILTTEGDDSSTNSARED